MFSPFRLCQGTAEGPWSPRLAGTRAVHMDALGGKKGKLVGETLLGLFAKILVPNS